MARASSVHPATELARRLEAFVVERFPFAVAPVRAAFDACKRSVGVDEASFEALRTTFEAALRARLDNLAPSERAETTPGVDAPGDSNSLSMSSSTRATASSAAPRSVPR